MGIKYPNRQPLIAQHLSEISFSLEAEKNYLFLLAPHRWCLLFKRMRRVFVLKYIILILSYNLKLSVSLDITFC